MDASHQDIRSRIERDGYALLPAAFDVEAVAAMLDSLEAVFHASAGEDASIRSQEGVIYAARNVLQLWPDAATAWRRSQLPEILAAVLGPDFGLVRVLYFDKPPAQSWALPWHKDLTIAVKDNRLPSARFSKPTRKAGLPHVEAPLEVLEGMLTARIHLDPATEENGPLKVVPGSHHRGKSLTLDADPVTILAQPGDTLLMRPLLAHSSGRSHPDTVLHRRILHLELAARAALPDGYAWHDFIPGAA
jgi:hypothetical protein